MAPNWPQPYTFVRDYCCSMKLVTERSLPGLFLLAVRTVDCDDDPPHRARALRIEAERCFRLAQGIASFELANELEALGHRFETEAEEIAAGAQVRRSCVADCQDRPDGICGRRFRAPALSRSEAQSANGCES